MKTGLPYDFFDILGIYLRLCKWFLIAVTLYIVFTGLFSINYNYSHFNLLSVSSVFLIFLAAGSILMFRTRRSAYYYGLLTIMHLFPILVLAAAIQNILAIPEVVGYWAIGRILFAVASFLILLNHFVKSFRDITNHVEGSRQDFMSSKQLDVVSGTWDITVDDRYPNAFRGLTYQKSINRLSRYLLLFSLGVILLVCLFTPRKDAATSALVFGILITAIAYECIHAFVIMRTIFMWESQTETKLYF